MNDKEAAAAAAFIYQSWQEHPSPLPVDAPSAVAGELYLRPGFAGDGWIPYWPAGEPEPAIVDNNRWKRTRLIESAAIAQVINLVFHWPSDAVEPHTYLMVIDVAGWSTDHSLTSSVIWAKLHEIQSVPEWTTRCTTRISDRVSLLVPFA